MRFLEAGQKLAQKAHTAYAQSVSVVVSATWGPPARKSARTTRMALLPWALAALCAVVVFGCPPRSTDSHQLTLPAITSDNPEAEADLRRAREAFDAGDEIRAETLYLEFLDKYPSDPLRVVANLALAQIHLARGEAEPARAYLRHVTNHPDAAMAEQGRLYDGVAVHLQGNDAEAIRLLSPFRGQTADPAETSLVLRTLAAAAARSGNTLLALSTLDDLSHQGATEEVRQGALGRVTELVADLPEPTVLELEIELEETGAAWPLVAKRALRIAYQAGNLARVAALAARLRSRGIVLEDELGAMALTAERQQEANPNAIGAIIPLTGRGREVGQLALRGMLFAAGAPEAGATAGPRVIFRDDGGDPERAAHAVEELVSMHQVIAIIGPIGRESSASATARARELGVPIITLASGVGAEDASPLTFRVGPTPDEEVTALARDAHSAGGRRVAVLHPDSGFGESFRAAMERSATAVGMDYVGAVSYPSTATSFREPIASLTRLRFDTLLIPDSSQKVQLIAPSLAAQRYTSAPVGAGEGGGEPRFIALLFPQVAFSPVLGRTTGRYLNGARFSVAYQPARADLAVFERRFNDRFGQAPNVFSALAGSSFTLIERAVAGGARDRTALAAALADPTPGEPTIASIGGFFPSGAPRTPTRVIQFDGTDFRPTEPSQTP